MTSASAHRANPSWIESFVDLTAGTQSPEIFRRWAAVSIIAGALERKVWVKAFKRTLFANLYILLVAGPGIGKTDALRGVREYWEEIDGLHVAPTSVSRASLTDSLNLATRQTLNPKTGVFDKFNALQVCAEEFGTFLTQYETEFMSTLNHLYDCISFTERKRASLKEPIIIPHPYLNIIAATTPAWLGGTLPETAWAEGFSSRLTMVFSAEKIKIDPFAESSLDEAAKATLLSDLDQVHQLNGLMRFEEEFLPLFREWYMDDCPPIPDHPKLEHYLPRRHVHFMKLCMIMSAARSNEQIIRVQDFYEARNLQIDTEAMMPEVFKAIKYNSDLNVIDEAYAFIWQAYSREGKAISEHRIHRFLSERAPAYAVDKILKTMVASRIILPDGIGAGEGGTNTYRPAPKASF
jgi:hypothetical protein